MMAHTLVTERARYDDLWSLVPAYGDYSPGEAYAEVFLDLSESLGRRAGDAVLDAGCGSGKGAVSLAVAGLKPVLFDLTAEGLVEEARFFPFVSTPLWADLRPLAEIAVGGRFPWVYCCDVLEHLPTEYVMLTLRRLLDVTGTAAFFSVGLTEDGFGAWIGSPLHLTVRPFTWWRDRLAEVGTVIECRDLGATGLYWVRP